ncbi:MAG: prephenate dehydratase [Candidatus Omnitrophota bacterium]|nr:prephenate dehydratase [Candidatus Omnitrophota bacterium]
MTKKKQPDLAQLRKMIDGLDDRIIKALHERTELALQVGLAKTRMGKEIYAPERESQIYRKLEEKGKGPLPQESLKSIYREIMSAALALEKPLCIAYLGPEATFTHLASLSKFGASVDYVPVASINEVFRQVERKQADYGVIPVENSIEGAVNHSLDMFIDSDLKICSEILFEIKHNLMSNSEIKHIRRVYSNPQVFGQCRHWIEVHLPQAELVDTASTTAAAKRAQVEDGTAAIGSKLAATIYNLPLLAEGIQDFSRNVTRFLVISRQIPSRVGGEKTSMLVSLKDKVGALYDMLDPIRKNKVNMTKIESRPSKKKAWEYLFFIDFEGHVADKKVAKMLSEIDKKVRFSKVLGSYPAAGAREA